MYVIVFSGLSLQGSAHERSQKFGLVAALKRKVQLITWLYGCYQVVFHLIRIFLNVHPEP